MKKILSGIYRAYLGPTLEFRVRLFNVLAMGGISISFVMAVLGVSSGSISNMALNLLLSALSTWLLVYSRRTGRYQLCYMITIIGIFICLFPVLFFDSGGYHSGMPPSFVFAVAFTFFMLEGKKAIVFAGAEILVYTAICIIAYLYPGTVRFFDTELELLIDIIVAFVTICVVLGACTFMHFRLYNEQQRKLDEQNTMLTQINRSKTEYLANASHEMRTPLTVISVNVQKVAAILEDIGGTVREPEAIELLADAQSEIMRMSRMVGGMLTLASISESAERSKIDLTMLLRSTADTQQLILAKRRNALEAEIGDGLSVFGSADLLSQAVLNLIQNAHAYTENDVIRLRAARDGGRVAVTVSDNGSGISPEFLPHVFERGVSGKDSGTGFGLFLCKTVVESHGGEIWIESEPAKGTTVHFSLPVYEGQLYS